MTNLHQKMSGKRTGNEALEVWLVCLADLWIFHAVIVWHLKMSRKSTGACNWNAFYPISWVRYFRPELTYYVRPLLWHPLKWRLLNKKTLDQVLFKGNFNSKFRFDYHSRNRKNKLNCPEKWKDWNYALNFSNLQFQVNYFHYKLGCRNLWQIKMVS